MTTHGTFTFDAHGDSDCQAWTFTSDNDGSGQTTTGEVTDGVVAAEFCWDDTDSGHSSGTGPLYGVGGSGDGYVYTECSSPGAESDEYTMTFETTLDASAEQWQLTYYAINCGNTTIGENLSTCEVQINESGGGWTTVYTSGGSDDSTGSQTDWGYHDVDLSEGGTNTDSSTQVRFLITTATNTQTYYGDYALDSITITGTPIGNRDQEGYRWRDDDGSESGASWLQNQDTNHQMDHGSTDNIRLRILTDYEGDPDAEAVQLEYKEAGDPASEWRKVPTS
jgi:hypothetical protein